MAEIKPKKNLKPQKSMLTGLLKPAIKFAYKTYIKKHPMFKETTEAFAKKQISRVDKRFNISAGLTGMVKQLIKQNPKLHPKGKKLLHEARDALAKYKEKIKGDTILEKITKGPPKHYKGGLMRKPKLARKGF
jgi:hypothetical protein|tara:strand:+ start:249 stop:647 length:399 start_codon:yes stop_codon:yes gene_type:complete